MVRTTILRRLRRIFRRFLIIVFNNNRTRTTTRRIRMIHLVRQRMRTRNFTRNISTSRQHRNLNRNTRIPLTSQRLITRKMTTLVIKIITSRINIRIVRRDRQTRIRNSTRSQRIINIRRTITRAMDLPFNSRFNVTLSSFTGRHRMQLKLFRTFKGVRNRRILTRLFLLLKTLNMMRVFRVTRTRVTQQRTRSRNHTFLFFTPRQHIKTSRTGYTNNQSIRNVRNFKNRGLTSQKTRRHTTVTRTQMKHLTNTLRIRIPIFTNLIMCLTRRRTTTITRLQIVTTRLVAKVSRHP